MNIALDATPLSAAGSGGIRRYTMELARALVEEFPEDHSWLLSDQPFPCIAEGLSNLHCGRPPSNALERRWWSFGLPRELRRIGAAVFHGTDFTVPYRGGCASVATVHDLSPWREPFAAETSKHVRRRAGALLRARRPDMVLTPTNAVRSEVLEQFRFEPDRVVVTPLAAASVFHPMASATDRRSFLHVGGMSSRRRLAVILDAWRSLRGTQDVGLTVVGPRLELSAEPGLTVVPDAADESLARWYSGAVGCLMPSRYEGFGLPLLEAMQCGCPVIASRDPALMEVSEGAAEHVDDDDVRSWRSAMEGLLRDPEHAAQMRARGLARAAAFSWARTARLTREVYAEAVRRSRR
jgi:glycosyltransferase involved in cell wall biosynthesis